MMDEVDFDFAGGTRVRLIKRRTKSPPVADPGPIA
jgi:hypothetical protein